MFKTVQCHLQCQRTLQFIKYIDVFVAQIDLLYSLACWANHWYVRSCMPAVAAGIIGYEFLHCLPLTAFIVHYRPHRSASSRSPHRPLHAPQPLLQLLHQAAVIFVDSMLHASFENATPDLSHWASGCCSNNMKLHLAVYSYHTMLSWFRYGLSFLLSSTNSSRVG